MTTATPSIHAAFAAAYQQIENPTKNSRNPAFKSTYANLEEVLGQVKPVLEDHNLVLVQESISDENGVGVRTIVYDEAGAKIDFGSVTLPLAKKDPQGAGSCLTYARRYALKSIFGLAEVDDDGNDGSKKPEPAPQTPANPNPPAPVEATGWAAVVESYKQHGTKAKVLDFLGMEALGTAEQAKEAAAKWKALSKPKQAILALIAVGAEPQ